MEVIITMEQAVVDLAGGKYTTAMPQIYSPSTQSYRILPSRPVALLSDFLDSPRFRTHENVQQTLRPMHSNIHFAVFRSLFLSHARTPCAALSTWFVSLLLLIMKTTRPILHSSSVFLLSRCGMSTLNSLPQAPPSLRIIDRR